MSTKILYFDHWQSATEFYRTMPLDYINHKELTIERSTERDIKAHLLNKYDVIFICRASSEAHLNLIKLAKDMHKKVIIDYDDNVLRIDQTNPMYDNYNGDKSNIIKCVSLADQVWCATEAIKESFRLYNKNISVIPNAHNDFIYKIEDKKPFKNSKTIMWRGGGSHMADIYNPGTAEWILKMINGNKLWKWYWLGQRFEWIEYRVKHNNFFYNPGASTIQFYKLMHELNPTIFFYPLNTTLFNAGKSNCSWLESSYAGAAYFGNIQLPEFDKPGIMALNYLQEAIQDIDRLRFANVLSWEFIKNELLLSKINKQREDRLIEIAR